MKALGDMPFADALFAFARWMMLTAVVLTMTTPRLSLGSLHITCGDVLAVIAGVSWLLSWVMAPTKRMNLRAALWPLFIFLVGAASVASSLNKRAAGVGLVE